MARKVWEGEPLDLTMGHLNALWQGDANAWALQCFAHAEIPPFVLNLAGPEILSVYRLGEQFAGLLEKPATFRGKESADAFLSNSQEAVRLLGYPRVGVRQMSAWIAAWVKSGGASLGKPTHYEVRDGNF